MDSGQVDGDGPDVLEFDVFEIVVDIRTAGRRHRRVGHDLGDSQILLRQTWRARIIRRVNRSTASIDEIQRLASCGELAFVIPLHEDSLAAARSGRARAECDYVGRYVK